MPLLIEAARTILAHVVTDRVLQAARGRTDVLTVGVDVYDNDDEEDEYEIAELVAIFGVVDGGPVKWTGKSYPTGAQEPYLVQVVDLATHCLQIAGERVLVLGCHDLNMFSPRGRKPQAADGARRRRCNDMRAAVKRFRPTVVLQHPHTTDSPNIWRASWASLIRQQRGIRAWASGICYDNPYGTPRSTLKRVRELTCGPVSTEVEDILIRPRDYRARRLRNH